MASTDFDNWFAKNYPGETESIKCIAESAWTEASKISWAAGYKSSQQAYEREAKLSALAAGS